MLYKYRTITDFKFFTDIVLNQRLYAAPYFEMNDPMEGHYRYAIGGLTDEVIRMLKGEKQKIRICSLSRQNNNPLMWAHYADGHRGVVIGVEVEAGQHDVRPVSYTGPSILQNTHIHDPAETAKRILCHKHEAWFYEEEERLFVLGGAMFANVKVREVALGARMSNQDKSLVTNLVQKIDPTIRVYSSSADPD